MAQLQDGAAPLKTVIPGTIKVTMGKQTSITVVLSSHCGRGSEMELLGLAGVRVASHKEGLITRITFGNMMLKID